MPDVSGGEHNAWPRFSPEVVTVGSDTYYTIGFSSMRGPGAPTSGSMQGSAQAGARIFLAVVRRRADGAIAVEGMVMIPGHSFDADDRTIDVRALTSVKSPPAVK